MTPTECDELNELVVMMEEQVKALDEALVRISEILA